MPDQIAIPDYISDSPIDSSPQGGAFVPRIRMMLTFVELVGACKDLFQSLPCAECSHGSVSGLRLFGGKEN
jgi:hypothetical protein